MWTRSIIAVVLALSLYTPTVAWTQTVVPPGCKEGTLEQQVILICLPPNWNGQLVVYAHGYVPIQEALVLPIDELTVDGQFLPALLLAQGYAFATSSYSKNGYAIAQAGDDLNALVHYFNTVASRAAEKVFMTGGSEGGLITTMLIEQHPDIYAGGLALCGPVGGMPYQTQYLGDFRVIFDYFFPGVFPFGVADVPADASRAWNDTYVPAITRALTSDPSATAQLFQVTHAAQDPNNATSALTTSVAILFYSIWGTGDLIATAGGMPFENRVRRYVGSEDDAALNAGVERIASSRSARNYLRDFYEPTGNVRRPLVTLHTSLDPVVPFRHELLYTVRALLAGRLANLTVLPVHRYGHCTFTIEETLGAFALLVLRTGLPVNPALHAPLASLLDSLR